MSKHVTEWLNAYLDGELKDGQIQLVEAHLVECPDCRAELEALARLSSLLHEVPLPDFTPPERFAAQVNLRLPRRQAATASRDRNTLVEVGWWMVPVGLLGAWIFINTSALVSGLLAAANRLGLAGGLSNWLVFGPAQGTEWSAALGQFGLLSGNSLDWAAATEVLTRSALPQLALQMAIAFLYLGWIAIWWARRQRQQKQLLAN